MKEKGSVVRVDGKYVWVLPVDISACINCDNISCRKDGKVFKAVNPQNLPLGEGCLVRVTAPVGKQLSQMILAVAVPILAAVAGYIITSFISPGSDGLKIGVALAALCVSAVLVYFISSRYGASSFPVIAEILTGETEGVECHDC